MNSNKKGKRSLEICKEDRNWQKMRQRKQTEVKPGQEKT